MKYFILILTLVLIMGCGQNKSEKDFEGIVAKKDYVDEGMRYLGKSDVKRAIQSFDMAIKQDPRNPYNYMVLGQVYLRLKNYTSATDSFSGAVRVDPNYAEAYYFLAITRNMEGFTDEAIGHAQKSVELFMKNRDDEKFKQSLLLLKSLTAQKEQKEKKEAMPQETKN